MDQAEETVLAGRLRAMDERAWALFCRDYSPVLLQFARWQFGCSRDKAEEVAQMTFVRCVRSIGTFDASKGRLWGWLKAIARNEAHTYLRKAATSEPVLSAEVGRMLARMDDESPGVLRLVVRVRWEESGRLMEWKATSAVATEVLPGQDHDLGLLVLLPAAPQARR